MDPELTNQQLELELSELKELLREPPKQVVLEHMPSILQVPIPVVHNLYMLGDTLNNIIKRTYTLEGIVKHAVEHHPNIIEEYFCVRRAKERLR